MLSHSSRGASAGLLLTLALTLAFVPVAARAQSSDEEGIPVKSEVVRSKCGGCHRADANNRMSRISYRRASPENWELTVKRMITLNHAAIEPADARAIVKYLADNQGLAPEEARPVAFEAERRIIEFSYPGDADTAALCQGCHSIGRVMSERRNKEEWDLLIAMHRGYYPLVDNQPIAGGQGFRRSRALPADTTDRRQPMEKAVAYLSKTYPLVTSEWASWSAAMTASSLAGRWAVAADIPGKGRAFGELSVTADPSVPDSYATSATLIVAGTGEKLARTGKALLYTGFQWRGRGADARTPDDPWREVMFVERNRAEMWGRWFTGSYDEIGMDVRLTKVANAPVVLGTGEPALKRGTASATLHVFGANLPSVAASDVRIGQGIEVVQVSNASPTAVTLQVSIAPDAIPGPRDLSIAGFARPSAFVVYDRIDSLQVLPRAGIARIGGVVFPKQLQQFEAVAFANGPDGKADTSDDVRLGPVAATWNLEEYTATYDDDDVRFVGAIDSAGLFTPNNDGPNPERKGNRNNVGDVWVVASYAPEGAAEPLRARAHLLVTVPIYMRWMDATVDAEQGDK